MIYRRAAFVIFHPVVTKEFTKKPFIETFVEHQMRHSCWMLLEITGHYFENTLERCETRSLNWFTLLTMHLNAIVIQQPSDGIGRQSHPLQTGTQRSHVLSRGYCLSLDEVPVGKKPGRANLRARTDEWRQIGRLHAWSLMNAIVSFERHNLGLLITGR